MGAQREAKQVRAEVKVLAHMQAHMQAVLKNTARHDTAREAQNDGDCCQLGYGIQPDEYQQS